MTQISALCWAAKETMSLNSFAVENYSFPLLSRSCVKMILKAHSAVQQSKVAQMLALAKSHHSTCRGWKLLKFRQSSDRISNSKSQSYGKWVEIPGRQVGRAVGSMGASMGCGCVKSA